jgi:FAD/FMN-containing dehydrogenase
MLRMDWGGEDGHLIVDMKYFYNLTLDNSTGIATLGPGARLGNVATALWNQGQRAISHGSCPGYGSVSFLPGVGGSANIPCSVGVGGHVLLGGFGFASHTYRLALDNMISATVARGELALHKDLISFRNKSCKPKENKCRLGVTGTLTTRTELLRYTCAVEYRRYFTSAVT